jgi:hypothetical protein
MPGRLCKPCKRKWPFAAFVWRDGAGRIGVTGRCEGCRHRGKGWNPTLPVLRYRIARHAAERYIERVRPELANLPRGEALKLARIEMRRAMATAAFETDWPAWTYTERRHHGDATVGFLAVDDRTLFLVSADPNPERRVIVTVLTDERGTSDDKR